MFGARILGAGSVARAEHLIARLEVLHILADRLDLPCQVESRNTVFRFEQPRNHPHGERRASHTEAVAYVETRRVNAYEHVVIPDHGLVDVSEFQDVE